MKLFTLEVRMISYLATRATAIINALAPVYTEIFEDQRLVFKFDGTGWVDFRFQNVPEELKGLVHGVLETCAAGYEPVEFVRITEQPQYIPA
jgi:hypothetical protein